MSRYVSSRIPYRATDRIDTHGAVSDLFLCLPISRRPSYLFFSSAQVTADPQSRLTNATGRGLARIFPSHAPFRSHGPSMGSVGAPVALKFLQDKGQSFGLPGASSDTPPPSHPFPSQAANIIGSPSSAFPWCEVTKQNHPSQMGASEGCILDDHFGTISCAGSRFQGET